MSQSDKIFGALLVAFIIYITVRGQLAAPNGYLGIFIHSSAQSSAPVSSNASGGSSGFGGFLDGVTNFISGGGSANESNFVDAAAFAAG